MSLLPAVDEPAVAYEAHEDAVLGMLAKRFPRFSEDERRDFYHDAWASALAKQRGGEQIQSLRNYLLASTAGLALKRIKSDQRLQALDPDSAVLEGRCEAENPSEETVLLLDQARIAREIIESLEERQRGVFKLRWDLQMPVAEVRDCLKLSIKQYKRIVNEGAAVIAERVTELHDGTWSRRQRSLLSACIAGIATGEQRAEAQRRLETDPYVRALFADVDHVIGKASALLPLPVVAGDRVGGLARVVDAFAAAKGQLSDALAAGKQHAAGVAGRADPTPLAGGRPGAAGALVASCLAVGGGGAYCATQGLPDAIRSPLGITRADPKPAPVEKAPAQPRPISAPAPTPPVAPPAPSPPPQSSTPPPPPAAPASTEQNPPPINDAERNFGIEQQTPASRQPPTPAAPAREGGGGGASTEFGIER